MSQIAKAINKVVLNYENMDGYIEPFCGMCEVYRNFIKLQPNYEQYIANDNDVMIPKHIRDVFEYMDVVFYDKYYVHFSKLDNFIIYCDPHHCDKKFWTWCQEMSKNNLVFVKSQQCPIKHHVLIKQKLFIIG